MILFILKHITPVIVMSHLQTQVFWSLVCLSAMIMFVFLLVSLVIKYFSFPVNVKVDQVRTIILLYFLISYDCG